MTDRNTNLICRTHRSSNLSRTSSAGKIFFKVLFVLLIFGMAARDSLALTFATRGSDVIMSDARCEVVQQQLTYMSRWDTHGAQRCEPTFLRSSSSCQAIITSCLPASIRTLYGRTATLNSDYSPNCHGLTLYTAGIIAAPVYVGSEIKTILASSMCQPVAESAPKRVGDIGIITRQDSVVHSFTLVAPSVVWTKNGLDPKAEPQLQSLRDLKQVYVDSDNVSECRICKGVGKGDPRYDECNFCRSPFIFKFYRCQSANDYFAPHPIWKQRWHDLNAIERELWFASWANARSTSLLAVPLNFSPARPADTEAAAIVIQRASTLRDFVQSLQSSLPSRH